MAELTVLVLCLHLLGLVYYTPVTQIQTDDKEMNMSASVRKINSKPARNSASAQRALKTVRARTASASKVRSKSAKKPPTAETRFRFGPKWIKSIQEGKGIAMSQSNRFKLLATAEKYDVDLSKLKDQDTSAIVAVLQKRID